MGITMENNAVRFKKGEALLKENETTDKIYLIKSGKVLTYLSRSGKRIEIETLGAGQICGEQAILQPEAKMPFDAVAESEVQVVVVPVSLIAPQHEKLPASLKVLFKSMSESLRNTRQALRNLRMDLDNSPMPQSMIAKTFAMLNLVGNYSGTKDATTGSIKLAWGTLKIYVTRMFLDSPTRMRGVLDLLLKLKFVELVVSKNDEGDEELTDIVILRPTLIESFADFYQFNYFKGGKAEVIYVDPMAVKVTRAILHLSKELEADRKGVVSLDYQELISKCKTIFKFELKNLHLDALEKKGLFVKRQTQEKGPTLLQFDRNEFQSTYEFWKIIEQIDQWNQKGVVDMRSTVEEALAESNGSGCTTCSAELVPGANFCANCGAKVAPVEKAS